MFPPQPRTKSVAHDSCISLSELYFAPRLFRSWNASSWHAGRVCGRGVGGGAGEKKPFSNNIYLCEVVRLQILVSPKVCFQTRRKAAACVCGCACACVRVPGSCTGPQGQACVDWVSSTHSSLVESERNPHRWLSTFKKSRLRETCQLRFKFLLLVAVTLQYSSNICLFPPQPTHPPTTQPNPTQLTPLSPTKKKCYRKHSSLPTSENVFSNERSDC